MGISFVEVVDYDCKKCKKFSFKVKYKWWLKILGFRDYCLLCKNETIN